MVELHAPQDLLHRALLAGDAFLAEWAVGRGANVSAPDATERRLLISSAAKAPDSEAMDWLMQVNPGLLSAAEAVTWLGKTLEGYPGSPQLWFADWLVARPSVREALDSRDARNHKPWSHLASQALLRSDHEALAWLMKPMSGWQEDPTDPLLVRALRYNNFTDYERNTPHVAFLLNAGVRPLMATNPVHPEGPGISPLSELASAYSNTVRIRAAADPLVGKATKDTLLHAVTTLWPLLVQAGDDPHRRLHDGSSPREQLQGTPAESAVMAWERSQTTVGLPPERHRARRQRS